MSFEKYSHFFREEEDPDDEFLEQQYQEFFEVIRIQLIILLLVTVLCFIASYIISHYRNVDLNSEVCFCICFYPFTHILTYLLSPRCPPLDRTASHTGWP